MLNKADHNRAHMMANTMFRVRTKYTQVDDDQLKAQYAWFERTGRKDIIAEAERLCNERLQLMGYSV